MKEQWWLNYELSNHYDEPNDYQKPKALFPSRAGPPNATQG
jgi:hypothetical protein